MEKVEEISNLVAFLCSDQASFCVGSALLADGGQGNLFLLIFRKIQMVNNKDLRIEIAEMVKRSGEGHIPSSFSIVDLIEYLYGNVLNVKNSDPNWEGRDYFILSKGHGCGAIMRYCTNMDLFQI